MAALIAILVTDENGVILTTSGLPEGWESVGRGDVIDALFHPEDFDHSMLAALAARRVDRLRLECRTVVGGELRQALCFGSRLQDHPLLLFAIEDVTRLRVAAEIHADHLLDPVTSLPSRVLHDDRLRHALVVDAGLRRATAVLRVNVAGLGPEADGATVAAVAQRIVEALPAAATVSRVGAQQFSIVLPHLRDGFVDAWVAADRIRHALSPWPGILVGCGVAGPREARQPAELVRESVRAMYRSGAAGARPPLAFGRTPVANGWLIRASSMLTVCALAAAGLALTHTHGTLRADPLGAERWAAAWLPAQEPAPPAAAVQLPAPAPTPMAAYAPPSTLAPHAPAVRLTPGAQATAAAVATSRPESAAVASAAPPGPSPSTRPTTTADPSPRAVPPTPRPEPIVAPPTPITRNSPPGVPAPRATAPTPAPSQEHDVPSTALPRVGFERDSIERGRRRGELAMAAAQAPPSVGPSELSW